MQFCAKIELALYVLGVESLVLFLLLKTLKKPNDANLSIFLQYILVALVHSGTTKVNFFEMNEICSAFLCEYFCYDSLAFE